jgi:hypothetical protein
MLILRLGLNQGVRQQHVLTTWRVPMPPRIRLFFLVFTVTLFLIAAVPLYRELSRRSDIWWTPHTMLVPLGESKDRVEIYARGKLLDDLIQSGQVRIAGDSGSSVLRTSDVGLRFNNWDRIRGARVPLIVIYAAMCGVAVLMFFLILTGRLAWRGETEPAARQAR